MKAIKDVRLKKFDYRSNGFYFVTIVAHNRQNLLVGSIGSVVAQFIGRFSETPGVSVDYQVVMPNHVHLIVILDGSRIKLGEIVRRFKARVSRAVGKKLWQPNYYEHVIRSEKALASIRRYILNNPLAEKMEWDAIYKGAQ